MPMTPTGRWLLFNIGCIECGVSSGIVGRYATKEMADADASVLEQHHGWRDGGQNAYEVFDLQAAPPAEYLEVLQKHGEA